ncbi:MAG TPA: ribonuclease PH [Verrucomicrobiae bacterium]|nr:ribonuclease PH [Verrucomicrobiae bacterium]
MKRFGNRPPGALRAISFRKDVAPRALGSVLCSFGRTSVICAVSNEETVPKWMKEQGTSGGWITAEYSMLPYSTEPRKPRDVTKGRPDGRSQEIQRLVGRSLRAIADLERLGPRTLWIDCDVIEADGGTRTAAITGSYVALALACARLRRDGRLSDWPLRDSVAAVSAGIVTGRPLLDLDYAEDSAAEVDSNFVMSGRGQFIEIQGSGEETTFSDKQLAAMLALARRGIRALTALQQRTLRQTLHHR